jgi:small subunit ribosomal protein S6
MERSSLNVRSYEVAVIIRADIGEENLSQQIETIQGWIESGGGKVTHIDHWGHRRLAYLIEKQRDGYYAFYKAEMSPEAPVEIERNLRLSENVLRYLIIREDE